MAAIVDSAATASSVKVQQLYEGALPDISLRPDSATRTTTSASAAAASSSSIKSGVVPTSTTMPLASSRQVSWPMAPTQVLDRYGRLLSEFEQTEIRQYPQVYFIGPAARKINASEDKDHNCGYDDDKGRYKLIKNDHVAYRYEVLKGLGKGSFGDVVKVYDHKTKTHSALKIIRNERRFHKQAQYEIKILDLLRKQDTQGAYNVIHMTDYFLFRNHLCITFELLHTDLYSELKSDGFKGFPVPRCRNFAASMLTALRVLRKNRIIHCDLKPENILLCGKEGDAIKVIDFGSSCFEDERIHSYIQSRFYRSPEVILGGDYGIAIDMWSLGCIMAELHTGHPLFPGRDEKEQLLLQMEVLGVPPASVLAESKRTDVFFNADGTPRYLTDNKGRKRVPGSKTLAEVVGSTDAAFLDFIRQCLNWDPKQRLTPREAAKHEFITAGSRLVRSASAGLAAAKLELPVPLAETAPAVPKVATHRASLPEHSMTAAAVAAVSGPVAAAGAAGAATTATRVQSEPPQASLLPRPARLSGSAKQQPVAPLTTATAAPPAPTRVRVQPVAASLSKIDEHAPKTATTMA